MRTRKIQMNKCKQTAIENKMGQQCILIINAKQAISRQYFYSPYQTTQINKFYLRATLVFGRHNQKRNPTATQIERRKTHKNHCGTKKKMLKQHPHIRWKWKPFFFLVLSVGVWLVCVHMFGYRTISGGVHLHSGFLLFTLSFNTSVSRFVLSLRLNSVSWIQLNPKTY